MRFLGIDANPPRDEAVKANGIELCVETFGAALGRFSSVVGLGRGGSQSGSGTYVSFKDAAVAVHELASRLVEQLAKAATGRTPALPPFNEVTWTHYPAGLGHISEDRDPACTQGSSSSRRCSAKRGSLHAATPAISTNWLASTGGIVVLTGWGWPTDTSRCPVHGVDPPASTDRTILTLRSDARGAGAEDL